MGTSVILSIQTDEGLTAQHRAHYYSKQSTTRWSERADEGLTAQHRAHYSSKQSTTRWSERESWWRFNSSAQNPLFQQSTTRWSERESWCRFNSSAQSEVQRKKISLTRHQSCALQTVHSQCQCPLPSAHLFCWQWLHRKLWNQTSWISIRRLFWTNYKMSSRIHKLHYKDHPPRNAANIAEAYLWERRRFSNVG